MLRRLKKLPGRTHRGRKWRTSQTLFTSGEIFGDHLYLLTHKAAPRFRVVRTSASNPDLARAEVVVPESEAVVTSMQAAQDGLYVYTLDRGISRLLRAPYVRGTVERIALPFDGAILGTDARMFRTPGMRCPVRPGRSQRQFSSTSRLDGKLWIRHCNLRTHSISQRMSRSR